MGQVWSSLSSDGEEATIAFYQAHRHASPTQRRGVTRDDSPYWSGAGVDSLTERCVEVIAGGIVGGRRFRLEALPAELTQLVVDVVSELGGGKNGAFNSLACADTLLESLEGARFFSLVMGGGAPGRARMDAKGSRPWSFTSLPPETRGKQNGGQRSPRDQPSLNSLFPASTLERLMVSDESQHPSAGRRTARIRTTPFDDKFLLRYAPGCLKLRFVHVSHCPHVTEVSVGGLLRGLPRLEDVVVAHCRGVGDVGGASGVGSPHLKRLAMESCLKMRGLGALLSASSDGCLASLRVLDLGRCRMLNNVDASQVARFSNLRWLDVSYTGITDEGVVRGVGDTIPSRMFSPLALLTHPLHLSLAGRVGSAAQSGVSETCRSSGRGLERGACGAADVVFEAPGRVADGVGGEQHAARAGGAAPLPARAAACRLHQCQR